MPDKKSPGPLGSSEAAVGATVGGTIVSGIHSRPMQADSRKEWSGKMKVLSVRDKSGELHSAVQILSHTDTVPIPSAELFPIRITRLCHKYDSIAEIRLVRPKRPAGDRYQFDTVNDDTETLDLLLEALRTARDRDIQAIVWSTNKKAARLYQRTLGFSVLGSGRRNETGDEVVLICLPLVNEELKERAEQAESLQALLKAS